jgi:hypothetical protein
LQSDIKRSISNGEERFNQLSLEERGKFDEETLVNVNNLRRRMMAAPKADRFNNEYIVVTILVAAEGEYKLPTINSNADLKDALRKLGSIPVDSIQVQFHYFYHIVPHCWSSFKTVCLCLYNAYTEDKDFCAILSNPIEAI